jgi:NitT/TauT family transport system substrate-binding protein
MRNLSLMLTCGALALTACKKTEPAPPSGGSVAEPSTATPAANRPTSRPTSQDSGVTNCDFPSFSLAWSEYPSWSTFGVAHARQLISGDKGKCGPIERRWQADIELREMEYDPCLQAYATGAVDAVCITNMDVLSPSLSRASVAIMPTSTSYGADAAIATPSVKDLQQLCRTPVHGLEKSVSEYVFARALEVKGIDPRTCKFANMDPGAAATAMQQRQKGIEAIMVWNPFVLDTLRKRTDARVLLDSTLIPGEVIDMVVVAQASLDKPGGEAFARAVAATYYAVAELMNQPSTRDDTLVALGEKFSDLGLEDMRRVVEQTLFYDTPQRGVSLFDGSETFPFKEGVTAEKLPQIMDRVVKFCVRRGITDRPPKVGYGTKGEASGVDLRFDSSYLRAVSAK